MSDPDLASAVEHSASGYRPVDLGRLVGLGPSQIRNYEKFGFLPPAQRSATGYRRYGSEHLTALRVARCLITGFGWQRALEAMTAVHAGEPERAMAVADERHAAVHRRREQVDQALAAMTATRHRIATMADLRMYRGKTVTIGAVAEVVGVNPSAIRYWESRGVVAPDRAANGRRCYHYRQVQQLQLIKLLREIDYGFDTIAEIVEDLSRPTGSKARRALEERRRRVEQDSRAAARATYALIGYLDGCDGGLESPLP